MLNQNCICNKHNEFVQLSQKLDALTMEADTLSPRETSTEASMMMEASFVHLNPRQGSLRDLHNKLKTHRSLQSTQLASLTSSRELHAGLLDVSNHTALLVKTARLGLGENRIDEKSFLSKEEYPCLCSTCIER